MTRARTISRAWNGRDRTSWSSSASPDNAPQRYLYRARPDGKQPPPAVRVSPATAPGTHSYRISPDAHWAFHTYSHFDSPPVIELVQLPSHRVARTLVDNARQ